MSYGFYLIEGSLGKSPKVIHVLVGDQLKMVGTAWSFLHANVAVLALVYNEGRVGLVPTKPAVLPTALTTALPLELDPLVVEHELACRTEAAFDTFHICKFNCAISGAPRKCLVDPNSRNLSPSFQELGDV